MADVFRKIFDAFGFKSIELSLFKRKDVQQVKANNLLQSNGSKIESHIVVNNIYHYHNCSPCSETVNQ